MRILAVNKFYYIRGGCESYYFSLNNLCRENGYDIIPFSMKDGKNFNSEYEKYFINNIDYKNMNMKTKILNASKIIYSIEAHNKVKKIIRDTKPNLAHLHNFQHQLSPSILYPLKKNNIPIVLTVHDLKVICPNYKMLNRKGICEECKGEKYYKCVANSCVRSSKINSMVNMFEGYLHKYLKSYQYIDIYICPSEFYRKKFIEFGIPENKMIHVPNFVNIQEFKPHYDSQNYFIYMGRLSEEKGIKTLIKAMRKVTSSKLYIVGSGPLEKELKKQIEDYNLHNVILLGFKSGKELEQIIKNSKFVILPSEWYENCPMSVIEAMAYGKPVIGSNLGGIPELIQDETTGLIFKAGDENDLAEKINYLLMKPNIAKLMGIEGRVRAEKLYDRKNHFEQINQIYKSLL